jgi:hypothetical protein
VRLDAQTAPPEDNAPIRDDAACTCFVGFDVGPCYYHPDRRPSPPSSTKHPVKDKTYQLLPLGMEAAAYLRWKRKRLTEHSRNAYESTLDKFARHFPHLDVSDFEPPVGTQRLEEWLDAEWGRAKPATYNRHLAVMRDFFKWQVARGSLNGDPTTIIDNAKKREVYRTTFNDDQRRAIIASQPELRDRIALRLLLHYGLRARACRRSSSSTSTTSASA